MSILHVVFKVGDADYVVAAADVLQMESYTGATRVPGALPYVAGVVQVRGRVVPVVDLRVRFGLPPLPPTLDSRIVVVQHHERTVGLLVDSAREVIKLTPEQIQPPPRMVADGVDGFVKAVAHLGQRLLMLVDFVKVIGEDPIHVS
ncbi:MAG TPA: chemotaxis protein CheW [Polyangiaceae bacterium]